MIGNVRIFSGYLYGLCASRWMQTSVSGIEMRQDTKKKLANMIIMWNSRELHANISKDKTKVRRIIFSWNIRKALIQNIL